MLHRFAAAALCLGVVSACAPGATTRPETAPRPTGQSAPRPDALETERVARSLGLLDESDRAVPELPLEDEATGPAAASWDIDVRSWEEHDRVSRYVALFGGDWRRSFGEQLSRGTVYEPMIRAALRAEGLPEDLYYLALVESGFQPHAYSRAAAVGMWQFMAPTARALGLRMDWWVDERRDPVASTYAAARFLRELRARFGSDFLAAAAYNGGPTRVQRILTQHLGDESHGDDAFFRLTEAGRLPRETQNYVPQLIAAALVAKEPEKYGITVERREPLAYDSVMAPAGSSLPAIAEAAGVPTDSVLALNPHYVRAATPIGRDEWQVRIPAGTAARFAEGWAAMDSSKRRAYTVVRARQGETLHDVARAAGMTTRELAAFNPDVRTQAGRLVPQNLRVPVAAVRAAMVQTPDPELDRLIARHTPPRTYTVRRGDTLDAISRRHGVTVRQLQQWNGMEGKTLIRPGQRLIVAPSGGA